MKMRAMVPNAFPKEDMANNFMQYRKRKAPIGAFQKGYDLNGSRNNPERDLLHTVHEFVQWLIQKGDEHSENDQYHPNRGEYIGVLRQALGAS